MGLFTFIRDAGQKLFGRGQAHAATPTADPASDIRTYIDSLNLANSNVSVAFDPATATVTLTGEAPDQATRERLILSAGNVEGVAQVDDRLSVPANTPEAASRFHTVARGDTLSAIAKTYYGNAGQYPKIFEANKPMLTHPDKIYPGQVLRIPD